MFNNILNNNKIFSRIPFGAYKAKLATSKEDRAFFDSTLGTNNSWSPVSKNAYLIEGLYEKPNYNKMIARWVITEGTYEDYVFSQYLSEIDFERLLTDITTQTGAVSMTPMSVIEHVQNNSINLYFVGEPSIDRDGNDTVYSKWKASESPNKKNVPTPLYQEKHECLTV